MSFEIISEKLFVESIKDNIVNSIQKLNYEHILLFDVDLVLEKTNVN